MEMMKKIFSFLLLLPFTLAAQDPAFSKYNNSLLQVNPAFAGSWACGRAEIGYRNQWPAISGNFQTVNVSYDQYQRCIGGFGVNYMHDDAGHGTIKTDRVDLVWAPYFALFKDSTGKGKFVIQPGVSIAWQQKSIDWSKLNFGDMIDPRRGFVYNTNEVPNRTKMSIPDVSAGILMYCKRVAGGIAVYHITEPDEGFLGVSKLPMRTVMHISGIIGNLDEKQRHVRVVPSIIYMRQQDFINTLYNATVSYDKYSLGLGYRNQDALIFSAGFAHGHFRASYSYDRTVSKLTNATGGSHEIHFTALLMTKKWENSRTNLRMFN